MDGDRVDHLVGESISRQTSVERSTLTRHGWQLLDQIG
jgi:hypothetical protein